MPTTTAPEPTWYPWNFRSLARSSGIRDVLALIALATAGAWWWFDYPVPRFLSTTIQSAIVSALLLLLFWPRRAILFGPVFYYDAIRLARRGRYAVLRTLYALAILALLLLLGAHSGLGTTVSAGDQQALSRFAESFFLTFMKVQFLAILLLTPAYVAGAVAEERERRTLEYLFTTCIGGGEIVVSKLMARLGNLGMLLLAGIPILSLIPLWGGVDPNLMLAGFAASAVTMASLAALSILFSVYAQKARHAIVLTYLTAALYLGLTYLAQTFLSDPLVANIQLDPVQTGFTYGELLSRLSLGNPLLAVQHLQMAWQAGTSLTVALSAILTSYALFHGVVALLCTGWAVARARRVAVTPRGEKIRRPWLIKIRVRPAIGALPMVWKELYTGRTDLFSRVTRKVLIALVVASFLPLLWFWGDWVLARLSGPIVGEAGNPWQKMNDSITTWVRIEGGFIACLALVVVALNAAGSISGERDRDTWDGLRSTPLDASQILTAKRAGSILSARWLVLWLCLIWLIGTAHGAFTLWRLPVLLLAWLIYAAFIAALGLYLSMQCRTTMRASMGTLGLLAGLALAPVLFGWLIDSMDIKRWISTPWHMAFLGWLEHGIAPQLSLDWLASPHSDLWKWQSARDYEVQGIFIGLLIYVMAAGYFRMRTATAFYKLNPQSKEDAPPAEQLAWRRRWRWGLIAAAACCLVVGIGKDALVNIEADRRLQATIVEIERDDPHWRWRDVGKGEPLRKPRQLQLLGGIMVGSGPRRQLFGGIVLTPGSPMASPTLGMDEVQQTIESAKALPNEPRWSAQNSKLTSFESAAELLETVLAQTQTTRAKLSTIQTDFQDQDPEAMLLLALRSARGAIDQQLQDVQDGKWKLHQILTMVVASGTPLPMPSAPSPVVPPSSGTIYVMFPDPQRLLAPGFLSTQRANLLHYFTRLIDISRLPLEEQVRAIEQMGPVSVDPLLVQAAELDELVPNLVQMRELIREHHQMQVCLRCAIVMIAVERYRMARGRWPETLAELVPRELLRIPLDPYSGRPLCYRRVTDGVLIYSVGPYGSNDGGSLLLNRMDPNNLSPISTLGALNVRGFEGSRLGFHLLDVEQRK